MSFLVQLDDLDWKSEAQKFILRGEILCEEEELEVIFLTEAVVLIVVSVLWFHQL